MQLLSLVLSVSLLVGSATAETWKLVARQVRRPSGQQLALPPPLPPRLLQQTVR